MGEAMLVRKNGVSLRGLSIVQGPEKISYYRGDFPDMTGTVVAADFGSFIIPLHESAWTYSPNRALTTADTAITIQATIGRMTKTAQVEITVNAFAQNFTDNSWESIAAASRMGVASQLWSVGDIKVTDYGAWRIIGFNHDDLDAGDACWRDNNYNGGTNKAGITLQWVNPAGRAAMNLTNTNIGGWLASNMNVTILPNLLETLPSDMVAVMRTVDKYTSIGGTASGGGANRYNTAANRLFILSGHEVIAYPTGLAPCEAEVNSIYTWYSNAASPQKTSPPYAEWTRSPHNPESCTGVHFAAITISGNIDGQTNAYTSLNYFPAFCI